MIRTKNLNTPLETIGEEIGQDLGAKMVKDYQDNYPNDSKSYLVGQSILEQILKQPGCVAIRFYYGLDESGDKALVYVGVNSAGENIIEYPAVDKAGKIFVTEGIIADRGKRDDTMGWVSTR